MSNVCVNRHTHTHTHIYIYRERERGGEEGDFIVMHCIPLKHRAMHAERYRSAKLGIETNGFDWLAAAAELK
jgi:hypothetical protein